MIICIPLQPFQTIVTDHFNIPQSHLPCVTVALLRYMLCCQDAPAELISNITNLSVVDVIPTIITCVNRLEEYTPFHIQTNIYNYHVKALQDTLYIHGVSVTVPQNAEMLIKDFVITLIESGMHIPTHLMRALNLPTDPNDPFG